MEAESCPGEMSLLCLTILKRVVESSSLLPSCLIQAPPLRQATTLAYMVAAVSCCLSVRLGGGVGDLETFSSF